VADRRSVVGDHHPTRELLISALHSLVDGVVVADRGGSIVMVNQAARRFLGNTSANVPLDRWPAEYGLYVPDSQAPFPADDLPLARAIRGEVVTDVEVYVRNLAVPSGAWVSVSGVPLENRDGRVLGGVVVFKDVSARRRADELSRRLSSAVEQTADAVVITNRAGVIEYVNPAFERITGHPRDEVMGQTPRLLKSGHQGLDYYTELWATILAGSPFSATVVNRRKNGELFHAEQTITPMRDDSSGRISHFVSVMRDITDRLRQREQQAEMQVAGRIQQRLFPRSPPQLEGYDIAGTVAPALDAGGDYFDFIPLPNGSLMLAVADACGHGVGPALIMAQTRSHLRSLARARRNLKTIVEEINTSLLADLAEEHFVTMLLASIDPRTGVVQWASAGHPSGFILDRSGGVKTALASTGIPLGLFPGPVGRAGPRAILGPGEVLVIPTDGFAETTSPGGAELGFGPVLEVVAAHRERPAAEILDRALEVARSFRAGLPQGDDLTLVVCKRDAVP